MDEGPLVENHNNKKYFVHEIVIMKNRYEPNNDSDNYFVWSKCNF